MTHVAQIVQDMDRLISSLRPNATKQFKLEIHEYFKRLNTSLYRPTSQTAQQTREKILKKVSERSDSKTQMQCSEAINNIVGTSHVQKKGELFKFLLKYSEITAATNNSRLFEVEDKMANLNNQTQQTFYGSKISANNNNNASFASQMSSSAFSKPRKQLSQQQLQPLRNKGCPQKNISELDIIRQVSYVMQNFHADHIKYTEYDTFQLKETINVPQTVRNMVSQLCQIGWLYKKIVFQMQDKKGSIEKALCAAVKEEINQYYRWLAIVQNGIQMKTMNLRTLFTWCYQPLNKLKWIGFILQSVQNFSGTTIISIINSFRPHGEESIKKLLNNLLFHIIKPLLHFIHNWIYKGQLTDDNKEYFVEEKTKYNQALEWFQRYRLVEDKIPNILDKQSAKMIFNTGKAISFLKNRCKCNYAIPINFIDPQKSLNQDIYESSNIVSSDFKNWLISVHENVSTVLLNELRVKYNLSYHLGSMKNFYLMGKGDFIQHLLDTLVSNGQLQKPKHQIYELSMDAYITEALNNCFRDREIQPYDLQQNQVEEYKGTKSQFFQTNEKKKDYQESQKRGIPQVEGSQKMIMLNGSKLAQKKLKRQEISIDISYRHNVLDRILSKKVQFSDTAWDAFNFQYSMDRIEPLYSILTPQLIENYQRVFQFLWKIRRIEYILKSIWLGHTKQFPKTQENKNFRGFRSVLHRCHVIRCGMTHFFTNFFGYLMIAIQSAWDRFEISLRKAKSLQEAIKQHRLLHNELGNITFGSGNKKNLRDSLMNVLRSIQQFKTITSRIQSQYKQYYQKLRTYQNRKKIMVRGYLQLQQGQLQMPDFNYQEYNKKVMEVGMIYDKTLKTFMNNLRKEGNETSTTSVLVFRLDFSEYFERREIGVREE